MGPRGQRDRRAFWRDLIAQQSRSGISVLAFCRKRNVSTASFYNWKRRLKSEAVSADITRGQAATKTSAAESFVAFDLPAISAVLPTHCEVLLVDGRRVRVPEAFARDSLIDLLTALRETA